ncbi:MAG TPA: hypothetical protein VFM18_03315 [Methanosarcina sp.]|nr:hypothetical protein [Methanosarcina sp.]
MKVIEIDCWEVTESYDRDYNHVAFFLHEQDAKEFAKQSCYRSATHFKKTFVICESIADKANADQESMRQAALAKLTKKERELLGLE